MLIDKILMFFYSCLAFVIDLIPSADFKLPDTSFDILNSTFACIGFLLPVGAITPIVVYIGLREAFRLAYAVWLVIKSYIPTISGS